MFGLLSASPGGRIHESNGCGIVRSKCEGSRMAVSLLTNN